MCGFLQKRNGDDDEERVRVFAHWCHLVVRRRDHRHSDGAVPVPRGYGFRLAMCSVNWMEAREFVILVPDPIAFAPWPGEPVGMRTGKSDVYQQPIAGLSPESSWVKEDPLVEETVC